jgi:hypothetical protein
VLWSLAYLVVRRLFEVVVLACRSPGSKELEILVSVPLDFHMITGSGERSRRRSCGGYG